MEDFGKRLYDRAQIMFKSKLLKINSFQVCQTVYKHFSKEEAIEAARQETIQRVALYVKDHPRARPTEIQSKVEEEINIFKLKLKTMGV